MALLVLGASLAMNATAQSRILPVLEATPDARSAAMGGALLGNANQMHIYSNPAFLLAKSVLWPTCLPKRSLRPTRAD